MSATGTRLTFERIVIGLRSWAENERAWIGAAVDLLIRHEGWLRRGDFSRALLPHPGDPAALRIDWTAAAAIAADARASTSELVVLTAATELGTNRYGIAGLGSAHRLALVDAFAAAAGDVR